MRDDARLSAGLAANAAGYFIEYYKSHLRNPDRQEQNRVYVGSTYVIPTAMRVYLRIVEEASEEKPRERKKRNGPGGRNSGY